MYINVYTSSGCYLTVRLHQHLTVLGKYILVTIHDPVLILFVVYVLGRNVFIVFATIIIFVIVAFVFIIIALAVFDAHKQFAVFLNGTINITDITATKHVTILLCHFPGCSYLTTIDVHLGLAEHITIRVKITALTFIVIASATAKHIAVYIAIIQGNMGFTSLVDTLQFANRVILARRINDTSTNSCNFTATEQSITNMTAIHQNMAVVHTTVVDITATIDTTTIV